VFCKRHCQVKDLPDDHIGHLFYLAQNAVVKASGPYPGKPGAPIENFVDTLVRMKQLLLDVEARVAASALSRKAAGQPPPLVLMYGHSMAGAAIGVLTGNGKVWFCLRVCGMTQNILFHKLGHNCVSRPWGDSPDFLVLLVLLFVKAQWYWPRASSFWRRWWTGKVTWVLTESISCPTPPRCFCTRPRVKRRLSGKQQLPPHNLMSAMIEGDE
jgi:hypothetical protein